MVGPASRRYTRWNVFHTPVHSPDSSWTKHSASWNMTIRRERTFSRVMEAFSKVKDVDGQMVGPAFKTMKSEFVTCQETIRAKKYDLHDERQHDQPEGALSERNMNRSQQTWVKTFM